MRLKKLVALGLALIMTTLALAGCGSTGEKENSVSSSAVESSVPSSETDAVASSTEEESNEIVFPLEETMNFSCLGMMCNTYYLADNMAWKALLERANITMDLTEIKPAEMGEKGGLIMASGDYPEVLWKCAALGLDNLGMEGILIPLEDLIREYAPNLTAILDEVGGWEELAAPDGHIYSLPNVGKATLNGASNMIFWINESWLENVGLKEPTNPEELYEVLKAFKEQDANGNGDPNDEIPMTAFGGKVNTYIRYLDGYQPYLSNGYFGVLDGEFLFFPMTDRYKKDYLEFYAKLYAEGLLDNNCFTQTQDQVKAIGAANEVYGIFINSSSAYAPTESRTEYGTLHSFNEEGLALNTGLSKNGLAITDKCENPEVIIAWADYLYTEEGGRTVRMGIEDVSYKINEDGTYSSITPEGIENRTYQCTLLGNATVPFRVPDLYYKINSADNPAAAKDNEETYGEDGVLGIENGVVMPPLVFTEEENEELSILQTDIMSYVGNYEAEVISGIVSLEDTWQEFQNNLKAMNVDKLVEIYTAAYERACAK